MREKKQKNKEELESLVKLFFPPLAEIQLTAQWRATAVSWTLDHSQSLSLCPALTSSWIDELPCGWLQWRADEHNNIVFMFALLDRFLSNLTQAAATDSPQSFIHGTPSVEVTHISLYFKLNVRCKALPKHVGLSTQHVSVRARFPGKPTCTRSYTRASLHSP